MTDTTTLDARIAAFAAEVRRYLSDLPADEVEDLTGGLEADLHDQAADGDHRLSLDDPEGYADELRASAGLPERPATSRVAVGDRIQSYVGRVRRSVESSKAGTWLLGLVLSLRPVWWVFRGWAIYQLIAGLTGRATPSPVPASVLLWALCLASVLLSIQWGRGKWAPAKPLRIVRTAATAVVIIAAPFLSAWAISQATAASYASEPAVYPAPIGLVQDGQRVSNIFAYDANGNPLTDVQLFDQNGNPLLTVGESGSTDDFDYNSGQRTTAIPHPGSQPGTGWNIYPLQQAPWNDFGTVDLGQAEPATPPFRTTYPIPEPALPSPTPMTTPIPETTSTPQPETTPTP